MTNNTADVIIIGAGLSGIGAACHLRQHNPEESVLLLESRHEFGGTWSLFKYPGIRSDSDMYTFGYSFKTWDDTKTLASGESIMQYIREAADEYNVHELIRYHQELSSSNFDTETGRWTLQVVNPQTKEISEYNCKYLYICTGYYKYDKGYTPEFVGKENFKGQIIHPQQWPENCDYTNKKVVVIGSGATAVTLLPAMVDKTKHITMLQRSPTYIGALPSEDKKAIFLKKWLPKKLSYRLVRLKNIGFGLFFFNACRKWPNFFKGLLIKEAKKELGPRVAVNPHFIPSYKPWDQRFCAAPDGDLFQVLRDGQASVITDHIECFTENGILLKSGKNLDADIIITATGLDLVAAGGTEFSVDNINFDISQQVMYKGLMLSNLPNSVIFTGYTNASWTLKVNLTSQYTSRVLKLMRKKEFKYFSPELTDLNIEKESLLNLDSGYINRSKHMFPQQGTALPWKMYQNYFYDYLTLNYKKLDDGNLKFHS